MDSLKLIVKGGYLADYDIKIPLNKFAFLTGKHIDWTKRLGKIIIIRRINGHIYVSDEKFIKDEFYFRGHADYTCIHVDDTIAMLDPNEKASFAVITVSSAEAIEWNIK